MYPVVLSCIVLLDISLQDRKLEDANTPAWLSLEMSSQSLNVTQRQKLYSHLGPIFTPGMTDLEHFGLLYTFSKMYPHKTCPKINPERASVKA